MDWGGQTMLPVVLSAIIRIAALLKRENRVVIVQPQEHSFRDHLIAASLKQFPRLRNRSGDRLTFRDHPIAASLKLVIRVGADGAEAPLRDHLIAASLKPEPQAARVRRRLAFPRSSD